ncbi:MAG: MogA/MoaB family molybdenum cofactor biosynthesis protein [Tissierellia bacterium]|nr:MogA/MoaB family molybdenum cofactor biosynthesis protein [Tissierellia bacterium]
MKKVKVITVSDSSFENKREDLSGKVTKDFLEDEFEVGDIDIIPDEKNIIKEKLLKYSNENYDIIITTGGTGFSKRDVTPEATLEVIEKRAFGIEIAMMTSSLKITPFAMLSRAICGIVNKSLIINLPGSPKAAKENLEVIKPALEHAVKMINTKKGQMHS